METFIIDYNSKPKSLIVTQHPLIFGLKFLFSLPMFASLFIGLVTHGQYSLYFKIYIFVFILLCDNMERGRGGGVRECDNTLDILTF